MKGKLKEMKRWQIFTGIALVVLGLIALIEAVFMVNLWRFLGPLFLIIVGALMILRPRIVGSDVHVQMPILGDIRKTGAWEATQHEIWWLVGSNRLDFTETIFPNKEAKIRIYGFVSEVSIILPEDVGLRVEASSVISELKYFEEEQERFFSFLAYETPNFISAEKRVILQTIGFVSEVKVTSSLI